MLKKVLQFLAFLSLGAIVLYMVYVNQSNAYIQDCALKGIPSIQCNLMDKLFQDFNSTKSWYLVLAVLMFMISNVARAARWNMLLKPLGIEASIVNSSGAIMMAYMANLVFPRAGEFVRAGVLAKYEGIAYEKSFGTVMTDRILDVISLLIVTAITFGLAYDDIYAYFDKNFALGSKLVSLASKAYIIYTFLLLVVLALFALYRYRDKLKSSKLFQRISKLTYGLLEGLTSVLKIKNIPLFLVYSVLIWVMYFLMPYAVFKGFGPTVSLGLVPALVVFYMSSLGIVFPSPGGMGSYHILVIAALAIYGVNGSDGFSFANIAFFSIQIAGTISFGLIAALLLPKYNEYYGNTQKSNMH